MKWSERFGCDKELERLLSSNPEKSVKASLTHLYSHKKELLLFKLSSKVLKKKNAYTNLPDLKFFANEIGQLDWRLDFISKHSKKCNNYSNSF